GAARPGGAGGAARRYAGPRDLRVARGRSGPRRLRYADRGGLPRLRPPGGALDAPRARAEGADQEGPDLHGLGAPATPARAARVCRGRCPPPARAARRAARGPRATGPRRVGRRGDARARGTGAVSARAARGALRVGEG